MTSSATFMGYRFTVGSRPEIRSAIGEAARASRTRTLVTPNVDHLVKLAERCDAATVAAYTGADMLVCDSNVLGFLARRAGIELKPYTGGDIVRDILDDPVFADLTIALAGPDRAAFARLEARYPERRFILIDTPRRLVPHSPEWEACVAQAAGAEWAILFSCLSFPKQELFAADIRARRAAGGVVMCVGASIDFLTGAQRRAPAFFRAIGAEWLFRLLSQPRRLFHRYVIDGPRIFVLYARDRARG